VLHIRRRCRRRRVPPPHRVHRRTVVVVVRSRQRRRHGRRRRVVPGVVVIRRGGRRVHEPVRRDFRRRHHRRLRRRRVNPPPAAATAVSPTAVGAAASYVAHEITKITKLTQKRIPSNFCIIFSGALIFFWEGEKNRSLKALGRRKVVTLVAVVQRVLGTSDRENRWWMGSD